MKKRSIALIIGLMSFALLGVMAMQLYFLRQSYQMQSELFDRSVNEALNNVAAKISKRDAVNFLNTKAREKQADKGAFVDTTTGKVIEEQGQAPVPNRRLTSRQKKIALLRDSLKRMILHKKMDDEMAGLIQGGQLNLQLK